MRPPVVWLPPPTDWAQRLRGSAYFSDLFHDVQIVKPTGSRVGITSRTVVISYMPTSVMDRCQFVADITGDPLYLAGPAFRRGMRQVWRELDAAHDWSTG